MASHSVARKKRNAHEPEEDEMNQHGELRPPHLEESSKRRGAPDGKYPARKVRIVYEGKSTMESEVEHNDNIQ